jgi:RNA-directed DNA polymerase
MLLKYLSKNMLLKRSFIETVANSASKRYKRATIKKHDGSDRTIYQPSRELKAIQRVIHDDILNKLPIHSSVFAYRKGVNLKQHVLAHKSSNYITRLDFKNFFNSIDSDDLENFISDNSRLLGPNWTLNDTKLLLNLVCFKGALTIGSVTSPVLSNSICFQLDENIFQICCKLKIVYTRYADDLYFSTNDPYILFNLPKDIIKIIRTLKYPKNLWLNKKKTIHTSKKRLRRITGIVLTPDGTVSIGRENKRRIRSLIFKWDTLSEENRLSLKGYLSFVSSVEPEFINRLCIKFGSKAIYDIIKYKNK